jgi:hypothetical protein
MEHIMEYVPAAYTQPTTQVLEKPREMMLREQIPLFRLLSINRIVLLPPPHLNQ